jgi:hypothetical protein
VTTPKPRAQKEVYEQPLQTVLSRHRLAGTTWADLECGHVEPATGKDVYGALRCQQCNPVPRGSEPSAWTT